MDKAFRNRLKILIGQNKTAEALGELLNFANSIEDQELVDRVLLVQRGINELENNFTLGLITIEVKQANETGFNHKLLRLIGSIDRSFSNKTPKKSIANNLITGIFTFGPGAVFLLSIFIFIYFSFKMIIAESTLNSDFKYIPIVVAIVGMATSGLIHVINYYVKQKIQNEY